MLMNENNNERLNYFIFRKKIHQLIIEYLIDGLWNPIMNRSKSSSIMFLCCRFVLDVRNDSNVKYCVV